MKSSGEPSNTKSILWDTYSDLALSPFATAILIMQAAHPDVGAAVENYSIYKTDPWGRLFRTGFSMMRFLYAGKKGAVRKKEARDLRTLHAHIKGTHGDGSTYFALHPQTFRVVPDTFLDGAIRVRKVLGKALDENELSQVYEEYLQLCELFGIPREELESSLDEFLLYYDKLLLNTMNHNETVAFLLGDMMRFGPDIKYMPMPKAWWRWIYKRTFFPLIRTSTLGFLDPRFREKHNISWSTVDERRYQHLLSLVKVYTKIFPRFLRFHPFALYVMLGGHGVKLTDYKHLVKAAHHNQ